jgi:hypothetical protein
LPINPPRAALAAGVAVGKCRIVSGINASRAAD